jgi:glycosyltransferase involved in cell wall biosynthesis
MSARTTLPPPCLPFPDRQRGPRDPAFAVVIPVYNHGGTIAEVARKAAEQGFPVIIVDDGSTDGGCGESLGCIPNTRLVRHPRNLGKGAALQTGMREAAKFARWAICMDADGQHCPEDMLRLVAAIPDDSRPVVVGRREAMQGAPWTSRFGRKFSNFWVWVASGVAVSDSQSGFRIYPLPEIFGLDVRSGRYQYEIEVLAKAAWHGIPVIEASVGVSYAPGGQRISHFRPWLDFIRNSHTFSRLIVRRVFTPRLWKAVNRRKAIP